MTIEIPKEQQNKVNAARKNSRPFLYDPNEKGTSVISKEFEQWLILSPMSVKAKAIEWIQELLEVEADDDYFDLLKEVLDKEKASYDIQKMTLESISSVFKEWRENFDIKGYEDVKEVGWLFQELQQGLKVHDDLVDIKHSDRFRSAANDRYFLSDNSDADRKTRLNTWIAVLGAY